MKQFIATISLTVSAVVVTAILPTIAVLAHVSVKPGEAPTASYTTFSVNVPNERSVPTTSIKLEIPNNVSAVTPNLKPGWTIDVQKTGEGESSVVQAITWSGNAIPAGFREEFTFSAKTPDTPADVRWNAFQTYQDGTVIAWNLNEDEQPANADGSPDFSVSGPFSVTKVVADATSHEGSHDIANTSTINTFDDTATYVAGAALLVSLASLFFATKKR